MITLTLDQWLLKPWPKTLGDNCVVINQWGMFAVVNGVKCGPYQNERELILCNLSWAEKHYVYAP
jgi:hypothetical protein